jgi:hypothetical protein
MGGRLRDGTNTVTVTGTASPGADVTVTVTAGSGNVVGWVGGVFDTADGTDALAGATPTADGKKCGTTEALTHNKALAVTTATFTWKVPTDAPIGKKYFARVVSLNGVIEGGDAQKFAISTDEFKVVAAGAPVDTTSAGTAAGTSVAGTSVAGINTAPTTVAWTTATTVGTTAAGINTAPTTVGTAGEVVCKGKSCADCIKETAACSWCDTGRAAAERAGSDATLTSTGSCTQGTECTAAKAGLDVKFTTCTGPDLDARPAIAVPLVIGVTIGGVLALVLVGVVVVCVLKRRRAPAGVPAAAQPKSNYGPINMAPPADYSEDWLKSGNRATNPNYDCVPANATSNDLGGMIGGKTYDIVPAKSNDNDYVRGRMNVGGMGTGTPDYSVGRI